MTPKLTRDFPTILVIFGATGDLMGKKIVPSLYDLYETGVLPKLFSVIGYSRRDLNNEQFRDFVTELLLKSKGLENSTDKIRNFVKLFSFQRGGFEDRKNYDDLAKNMGQIDGEWRVCANKLFYLAVPPEYYSGIFKNLHDTELTKPCSPEEGWTRVLVEKPFGRDLKTAEDLDQMLSKIFKEIQIYRIDHYLAKEMLQSILSFRFSNNLLESNWNNNSIEKIEIKTWETLGVEKRGAFYDGVGAFRDVGQNHLLQMLALVTMEQPQNMDADEIREKRSELLLTLKHFDEQTIIKNTFRSQYEGYRQIENVKNDSNTETYFKVKAELNSERWKGVPIYLEAGKRLGEAKKEIIVTFKHATPCLCAPGSEHNKNKVTFKLEPNEGINISFWSKKPGLTYEIEEHDLNFTLRDPKDKIQYIEEYRKLLLDCINGDQTLFVSTKEVRSMWKYSDPISKVWAENKVPLHTYKPDTSDFTKKIILS